MNFLAHAEVARRIAGDDAEFLLGAVLPDLAAMLGLRLERDALAPRVRAGWRAHHRMDEAFHAHPAFLTGMRALHADLALDRGPRRAVAHVGWELLLDDTVDGAAFGLALDVAPTDVAARFRTGVRPPVAERVWRAVSRRPRLAFPAEHLDHVGTVLDAHAPGVAHVAPSVLDEVAAELVGGGTAAG